MSTPIRLLALAPILAGLLLALPQAPVALALDRPAHPVPRPGDVMVSLTFRAESDAAWAGLEKLGYRAVGEQRVMTALPGGKRACIAVFRGFLPATAIAAAGRVPGVEAVRAVPPGER